MKITQLPLLCTIDQDSSFRKQLSRIADCRTVAQAAKQPSGKTVESLQLDAVAPTVITLAFVSGVSDSKASPAQEPGSVMGTANSP